MTYSHCYFCRKIQFVDTVCNYIEFQEDKEGKAESRKPSNNLGSVCTGQINGLDEC